MRLPDGEPAPADGALPHGATAARPFGVYVHVPFCAARCGYCDFNTYVARGGRRAAYADAAVAELGARAARARRRGAAARHGVLRRRHADAARRRPTCARSCARSRERFGLAPGAEVTVEANPETVDRARAAGAARRPA